MARTLAQKAASAENRVFLLSDDWARFLEQADSPEGMPTDEYDRTLDHLVTSGPTAIDSAVSAWRQLEAQDKALKAEQERLGQKRKSAERHISAIKQAFLRLLKTQPDGRVSTQINLVYTGKSAETVRLLDGFPVTEAIGRTKSELVFDPSKAAEILEVNPEQAKAMGIVKERTEFPVKR